MTETRTTPDPFNDTDGYDAALCARRLTEFGIDLPQTAQHALNRLNELRADPPITPHIHTVAQLLADDARPSTIDKALAQHLAAQHRATQHTAATNICGRRLLTAVMADAPRIHAELKVQADGIIERLHRAAHLDGDVADLTRQRRVADAHALATAPSDAEELRGLFRVRDDWLTPNGTSRQTWSTGWWSCQHFENPWDAKFVADHDGSLWEQWRATIRAGGRLAFMTLAEARALSQTHEPTGAVLPPIDPRRPRRGVFVT